ncbi:hypothetical protein HN51_037941 [Arachis hypogaea]|uniref:Cupin type-1 domain-containing protein n=1 Tax=Arachis hypogaea TaxID=3818 RepID=A0A444ZU18_ARAHY|nr:cocosin 1 [Arachis hypogaea]QHO03570.1 Glutelin type-A [Arachis hypogaea]QHO03571.1 Glutelin type-A [Arachis hypogaea]RYR17646.1 hypothetical protein Ahy_B03g062349 [Arachis hypogaea]
MELELTPKRAEIVFEGDGGGYYAWSSPMLSKFNLGGGRLHLKPWGFALPHYGDVSKVGYVIQGNNGVAGIVLANTKKEVVVKLKQGDIIPVPIGSVSWWFNNGDSDVIIAYLGETSKAIFPGQINYFFLSGFGGILGGFSSDLTSKSYNLNKDETKILTTSQTGAVIIKLQKEKAQDMPHPHVDLTKKMVHNIDASKPDYSVNKGGSVTTVTSKEFPFIGEVGLSVIIVKLEPNAIKTPSHSISPVAQLIYIARGGGKIEIVGLNGQSVLDTQVEAGQLLLVPQFFVAAQIAGDQGMETYSVVTTENPLFEELAGKASVWGAMSPIIQEVALNVDSEFQKLFISKIEETTNLIPSDI